MTQFLQEISLPEEVVERLVKRPEDLPDFVEENIAAYKSNMLRLFEVTWSFLEALSFCEAHVQLLLCYRVDYHFEQTVVSFFQDYMADHNQQRLIELDANHNASVLFDVSGN